MPTIVMGSRFLDSLLGDILHSKNRLRHREDNAFLVALVERYFIYSENQFPYMSKIVFERSQKNENCVRRRALRDFLAYKHENERKRIIQLFDESASFSDDESRYFYLDAGKKFLKKYSTHDNPSDFDHIDRWIDCEYGETAYSIAICVFLEWDPIILSDDCVVLGTADAKFAQEMRDILSPKVLEIRTRDQNYRAIESANNGYFIKNNRHLICTRKLSLLRPEY